MVLNELYETIEKIGVMTFSTIHDGEVHSCSAHFNGFFVMHRAKGERCAEFCSP